MLRAVFQTACLSEPTDDERAVRGVGAYGERMKQLHTAAEITGDMCPAPTYLHATAHRNSWTKWPVWRSKYGSSPCAHAVRSAACTRAVRAINREPARALQTRSAPANATQIRFALASVPADDGKAKSRLSSQ